MPVTSFANGTQTATVTTEHTLTGVNVAGQYQLVVDLVNMAANDILELRVYQTVLTGGTNEKSVLYSFYGVQDADFITFSSDLFNNPLTDSNSLKFTLKQTAGTGRNYPWSVNSTMVEPTNFSLLSIDASGRLDISKILGTAISTPATAGILDVNVKNIGGVTQFESVRINTATAGTGTTLTLDASASAVDSYYNGSVLMITSGANVGVCRTIIGYVGATKVATFAVTLPAAADATPTFVIKALRHVLPGTDGRALVSTDVQDLSTTLSVNAKNIAGAAAALDANNLLKVDVEDWKAGVVPAVNVTGVPKVDMIDILGTAVSAPATAGILDINVKNMNNVSASAITTIKAVQGLTTADTIATYTGNTVQTGDSFARLGAPAGASVSADVAAVKSDSSAIKAANVLATGTATAGGASTITLQTALGADTLPVGCLVCITGGTGVGQARVISAYVNATKVTTVGHAWTTNPDNTSVYYIVYGDLAKVDSSLKVAGVVLTDTVTTYTGNTVQTGDSFARIGANGASLTALATPTNITAGTITTVTNLTTNNDKTGYSLAASQIVVKKNVALSNFSFVMIDSSDHITPKTGLTVTATRSIDGAAFGACTNSVTELSNGFYLINLSAADLNGNVISLKFTATGADQRSLSILTQA